MCNCVNHEWWMNWFCNHINTYFHAWGEEHNLYGKWFTIGLTLSYAFSTIRSEGNKLMDVFVLVMGNYGLFTWILLFQYRLRCSLNIYVKFHIHNFWYFPHVGSPYLICKSVALIDQLTFCFFVMHQSFNATPAFCKHQTNPVRSINFCKS